MPQSGSSIPHESLENSLGTSVIIVNVVFFPLATASLVLRIWSRSIMNQSLCLNDYLVLSTWPLLVGLVGVSITEVIWNGWGQNNSAKTVLTHAPYQPKASFAGEVLWNITASLCKLSVLDLYIRIFPRPIFRRVCLTVMAVLIGLMISVLVSQFVQCQPFAKLFHPQIPGKCINSVLSVLVASVLYMCADLIIITLPMPFLLKLKVSKGQRLGLFAVFGCGALVCTTNALRIYRTATFSRKDFVNSLAQITLVSDLEPCLSMICACVPVILPALKRILGLHTQRSLRNRYDNTFLRLRAEAGDRSRSRGLDDAIPLTYTKVTASHKGTDSTPQSKLDNSGSAVPDDRVGSKLVIEVKNDWSVVSSP